MAENDVNAALRELADFGDRLQEMGFEPETIASALLSAGLAIGDALQGPLAVAATLRQLAQRFTGQAVAAVAERTCEPANQPLYEAFSTATISLQEQGYETPRVAEAMTVYAIAMGAKNGDPAAWSEWLARLSECYAKEAAALPSSGRH